MKQKNVGTLIGLFLLDDLNLRMAMNARKYATTGSAASGSATMMSNHISHTFDFAGPSMTVDTACSGGLVASLHLACLSLQNGESNVAIASGSNIMLGPSPFITMCKGKFLSKDGHSKGFFANRDGYR